MSKPMEFRKVIAGFGSWRIAYDPDGRKWALAYTVRISGVQWVTVSHFALAETAALAVGERNTGAQIWDGLRFAPKVNFDLTDWKTDVGDGVQSDAAE